MDNYYDNNPSKRIEKIKAKSKTIISDLPKNSIKYVLSLFPILFWIKNYNLIWLSGDIVAGLTVGSVVIPQGMGYAVLASLEPEYGLYSSFVGVSIYCLFSTSKDITIGPTAVMSLLIGQIITEIEKNNPDIYSAPQIAISLALICGLISLVIGLLRLGIIVDFIPAPVVAGFTTGSAITITIPKLLGITNIDSKEAAYLVLGKSLGGLPRVKIDAALGIFSLVYLYGLKHGSRYLAKRYPTKERLFFFIEILRNITVVIICTLIAFLLNIGKDTNPFKILKNVPSGFSHIGPAYLDLPLMRLIANYLPSVTIIMILEHVAIAKSFGRINNYKINSNQELIAIGTTNILGSFFGSYPTTGSFSRTALKAKSGVRTPLAGVFAALLVILVRLARAKYEILGKIKLATIQPPDGVLIFRLDESLTYPNASYIDDQIVKYCKKNTQRVYQPPLKKGDRPWNDFTVYGDASKEEEVENSKKPILNAIVFDFIAVGSLDSTGLQFLIDMKKELNKYSGHHVEYHFANVISTSIKNSLIVGGFGTLEGESGHVTEGDVVEQIALSHNDTINENKCKNSNFKITF
ncbi:17022_t:CDS:2 [Entrophospora sp. SA101]|nr:17022_t:CDS:2 [Entrophospora sp. SA101]